MRQAGQKAGVHFLSLFFTSLRFPSMQLTTLLPLFALATAALSSPVQPQRAVTVLSPRTVTADTVSTTFQTLTTQFQTRGTALETALAEVDTINATQVVQVVKPILKVSSAMIWRAQLATEAETEAGKRRKKSRMTLFAPYRPSRMTLTPPSRPWLSVFASARLRISTSTPVSHSENSRRVLRPPEIQSTSLYSGSRHRRRHLGAPLGAHPARGSH